MVSKKTQTVLFGVYVCMPSIIVFSLIAHSWVMIIKPIRSGDYFYNLIRGPRFLLIYQVLDYFDHFVRISFKRLIDWLIHECFDCDVYVATHFEKSTHFDKKIQSALKRGAKWTHFDFFSKNWGPTQPTLKTIFLCLQRFVVYTKRSNYKVRILNLLAFNRTVDLQGLNK